MAAIKYHELIEANQMKLKNLSRYSMQLLLIIMVAGMALIISACTSSSGSSDEESGVELARDETYDQVRNGARLVLSFNPDNNSFNGFVENTTGETLERVRVEVHLSNGVELGPTTPVDLAPGEIQDIKLSAKNFEFDSWTAHPEVGGSSTENGHREGEDEHGQEGEGEHSEGGSE
jgi:hypothetical protein